MFTNTFKPPDHSCLVNKYPQSLYQFEVSASTRCTWGLPFTITTVVLIFFLTISVSCIQWRGVLGGYKYEELATDARSSFQLT